MSLCGYEVQQFAAHITSQSYHKPNSINVAPAELACVLITPVTVAFPPDTQGEDEIC